MMIRRAMTVAGSDSGGGAGLQADLKTFTAMGVSGSSIITALTAQNSLEVRGIFEVPPSFVELQMDAVLSDIGTDAAKTGMLYSADIIKVVSRKFREYSVPYVVDPVMISKSGSRLLRKDAIDEMISSLLPGAVLITPNIPEAETLSSVKISNREDAVMVAEKLHNAIGCAVLVKGGHSQGENSIDILCKDGKISTFSSRRINTENTHGTGDTLSAAITSCLALGLDMESSIREAKSFLDGAIKNSFNSGKGFGSLNHFWRNKRSF